MNRNSIFDPGSPYVERSGTTFAGPDAADASSMPPEAVDGVADPQDDVTVPFDGHGDPMAAAPSPELLDELADDAVPAPVTDDGTADDLNCCQEAFENPTA